MKTVRTILIIILVVVLLVLLVRCGMPLLAQNQTPSTLPLDLTEMVPTSWKVLPEQYYQCDFDGDAERERLVFYVYDPTTVVAPFVENPVARNVIGGVVFDSRVNLVPQEPGTETTYRPAVLNSYRLLPDIYPGKGQGYLGETHITLAFSPPIPTRGDTCSVQEITVFGYSDSPLPTRLSIFRWGGDEVGYRGQHFVGNAQVKVGNPQDLGQPVDRVTTYNQLNDRSQLCVQRGYLRQGAVEALSFAEDAGAYTIDFCYGAPDDPAHPEGVVVALLRGDNPDTSTPTGASYLTAEAMGSLPPELASLQNPTRDPYRILSLSNPGTLPAYPAAGTVITDTTGVRWVLGQERVEVQTSIVVSGAQREAVWYVASLANERVQTETHWRVESVTLQ